MCRLCRHLSAPAAEMGRIFALCPARASALDRHIPVRRPHDHRRDPYWFPGTGSPRLRRAQFADKVQQKVDEFQAAHDHAQESDDAEESSAAEQKAEERLGYLHEMTGATHETGERLITLLTPWISYIVLPLFALSNVRVHMSGDLITAALGSALAPAILAGLVVGKPVGFLGFSWIATRFGIAEAPENVTWPMIAAIGCTAGIGFTISLFISSLAFADEATREVAALAIILASLLAGIAGYVALRLAAKMPSTMQQHDIAPI